MDKKAKDAMPEECDLDASERIVEMAVEDMNEIKHITETIERLLSSLRTLSNEGCINPIYVGITDKFAKDVFNFQKSIDRMKQDMSQKIKRDVQSVKKELLENDERC